MFVGKLSNEGEMMKVVLVKLFRDIHGEFSTHIRPIEMSIAPFVGLGVVMNKMHDPEEITGVFISSGGEVVAVIEFDDWGQEAGNFAGAELGEWDSQMAYNLEGWDLLANDDRGQIGLYGWGEDPEPNVSTKLFERGNDGKEKDETEAGNAGGPVG